MDFTHAPAWLGAPVVAAVFAALGYVSKLLIEEFTKWRSRHYERRSKLVVLQSLLLASRRVYEIQNELVRQLYGDLPEMYRGVGKSFDEVFAATYPEMKEQHKLMHGLIRAYTIHAMRPLNQAMIDWLAADTYFKGQAGSGSTEDLASNLQTLEAHLLLWRAKHDFWIPDRPERAIVYMADERAHGVGFPTGIEAVIAKKTGGPIKPTDRPQ